MNAIHYAKQGHSVTLTDCSPAMLSEAEAAAEEHGVAERLVLCQTGPEADNEQAVNCLRTQARSDNGKIQWAAVRPDTLIDAAGPTEYEVHASPTRGIVFGAGSTSRANVAHFMAELILDEATWGRWMGQMPVIYNKCASTEP